MKKFFTALLLFILIALLSFSFYKAYLTKAENKSLNEKLDTIMEAQSDTSADALDYYKKLSERELSLLSSKQLIELAQKEWKYTLEINDKEFTGQSINISGNQIIIRLSENREARSALPEELRLKGQISGYFYKQISIDSKVLPEITNSDEEYTTSVVYKFYSLSSGSQIKITLSDELKDRLGLKYNNYIIHVH